ncbi:ATP-binding cassette domain-containing protein [Clostridium intestinale]|uniref:ABC-2 type transport system ATP-binding protein n=1 Tax=Clostridium intestinale DSM 6191 TaxID=1121320 RepID=A0A1M5YHX6_9CLOT|nr:ABC transporter ATP-binding protein [Clostridium intestinale]SHI11508.1 ABC-2 type transport system ATP-binding protein [Clostridium intestinale DSM 6191]
MYVISNITKKYDDKTVFENISFNLPEKSVISLIGNNGVGKTTLLNILSGIIRFKGNVEYNGITLKDNYIEYMKNVVLISNNSFLYEYLTLDEHVKLAFSLSENLNREEFDMMLNKLIQVLNVEEYKNIIVKNLSLGTRQKVLIIISMLAMPKVILFDEPFVNLDQSSVDKLLTFLNDYNNKNNSIIIFSTHSKDRRLLEFTTHILEIIDSKTVILKGVNR